MKNSVDDERHKNRMADKKEVKHANQAGIKAQIGIER